MDLHLLKLHHLAIHQVVHLAQVVVVAEAAAVVVDLEVDLVAYEETEI